MRYDTSIMSPVRTFTCVLAPNATPSDTGSDADASETLATRYRFALPVGSSAANVVPGSAGKVFPNAGVMTVASPTGQSFSCVIG
jgi:hypothetical protein